MYHLRIIVTILFFLQSYIIIADINGQVHLSTKLSHNHTLLVLVASVDAIPLIPIQHIIRNLPSLIINVSILACIVFAARSSTKNWFEIFRTDIVFTIVASSTFIDHPANEYISNCLFIVPIKVSLLYIIHSVLAHVRNLTSVYLVSFSNHQSCWWWHLSIFVHLHQLVLSLFLLWSSCIPLSPKYNRSILERWWFLQIH